MQVCGYRTGVILDPTRPHWKTSDARPIAWSAWYPAQDPSLPVEAPQNLFAMGAVRHNAPLQSGRVFPVVLLSHGTGGTAESIGWLARSLAGAGFVVLAANHHGNTGLEPYLPEGFLCWWERNADMSLLLTELETMPPFAGVLDMDRVFAAGYSLGGYVVLALAGARTSVQVFSEWGQANDRLMRGPRELPDAVDEIPLLLETSDPFRQSWNRQGDDYSDDRIKGIVSIAPAPTVRAFLPETVQSIACPVTLISGGDDPEAPKEICGDWVAGLNPAFEHHDLGSHVAHYTLLEFPSDDTRIGQLAIFTDHPQVNRAKVHAQAAALTRLAFGQM